MAEKETQKVIPETREADEAEKPCLWKGDVGAGATEPERKRERERESEEEKRCAMQVFSFLKKNDVLFADPRRHWVAVRPVC